jgi:hypothetical protein
LRAERQSHNSRLQQATFAFAIVAAEAYGVRQKLFHEPPRARTPEAERLRLRLA